MFDTDTVYGEKKTLPRVYCVSTLTGHAKRRL